MSIEYREPPTVPRRPKSRPGWSYTAKIFLAILLIAVVAVNLASLPSTARPPDVETTPEAQTASSVIFKAEADARVEEENPTANAGASPDLESVSEPGANVESYLRFSVSGLTSEVEQARLLIYSTTDASENGPALYATDNNWDEASLTWSSRPPHQAAPVANQDFTRRYSWVEYDVSEVVTADGTYSFVLAGDSNDTVRFYSREGTNGPRLVITLASGTPEAASTPTAEGSVTSEAANVLTFSASADASVVQASPSAIHGTSGELNAEGGTSGAQISYIRFTVKGVTQSIHRATLRIFSTQAAGDGPAVHFADNNWTEAGAEAINWDTQPALLSGPVDDQEAVEADSWVEYDVTAVVTGDGTYTFALMAESPEAVTFSSREGKAAPELVVMVGQEPPTPTPTASSLFSTDTVLVGAGDIATCTRDQDELTAQLLDQIPGTVFTLGDNAYVNGTAEEFATCYDASWGRHKARTRPIPGNHDYNTSGAAGYFAYFEDIPPYYAYDLGEWRIYALNSQIDFSASSPQLTWLKEDLAANPRMCVLAYWHTPRWASGTNHGSHPEVQPLWQMMYEAGAELVLNGHEHNYERFAEMDDTGAAIPQGLREFVVGTGGAGLYPIDTPLPTSEAHSDTSYGVLKLTLHASGYDWEFVPAAGSTFTDSGSGTCHP